LAANVSTLIRHQLPIGDSTLHDLLTFVSVLSIAYDEAWVIVTNDVAEVYIHSAGLRTKSGLVVALRELK